MVQQAYFFNGTTLGDATLAPYYYGDFTLPSFYYGNFVVPEYGNELLLSTNSPTNGQVKVDTGAAMVLGILYENTSVVTVAITAAVNNRIDRIVLRVSGASQTVRITKIIGVEAANPSPPALGGGDFELGWVYVPAGFNPATTAVAATNVHDERLFAQIGSLTPYYNTENIMPNSEWFGYSGGAAGNLAPDRWILNGVPTTSIGNANLANFPLQPRGQSVRIRSNAGIGMLTRVPTRPYIGADTKNLVYTLKGSLYLAAGSVQVVFEYEDSVGNVYGTVTRNYFRTGTTFNFIIRTSVPNSFADSAYLKITINANSAASDFYVGQLILVRGYVPGNFRIKHETVWFDNDVLDAAWNSTAKSSGTTTINVVTSFGNVIPPYFRALICRIRGRDSGSAGALSNYLAVVYPGTTAYASGGVVGVEGLTNDVWREQIVYVPVDHANANAPFDAIVVATGAGTFDATIQPIGIVT